MICKSRKEHIQAVKDLEAALYEAARRAKAESDKASDKED
jgi:hypothetical protein